MQDEFITHVGGTSGTGLHSLWFKTNKAQHGPFGRASGTPFEQAFPQGNSLSYVFGRVRYTGDTTDAATVPCTVVTELGFGYTPILGAAAQATPQPGMLRDSMYTWASGGLIPYSNTTLCAVCMSLQACAVVSRDTYHLTPDRLCSGGSVHGGNNSIPMLGGNAQAGAQWKKTANVWKMAKGFTNRNRSSGNTTARDASVQLFTPLSGVPMAAATEPLYRNGSYNRGSTHLNPFIEQ